VGIAAVSASERGEGASKRRRAGARPPAKSARAGTPPEPRAGAGPESRARGALEAPDKRAPGLTAGWLYGRGVALAARGRLADAQQALAELEALATATPADAMAGYNTLRGVLAVAQPIVAARVAATGGRTDEAIADLRRAVAAEDGLAYNEPADWYFPARHLLGAELLVAGRAAEAERVYREDLERNPANGWALYGLAQALRAEGRTKAAAASTREFTAAWKKADVRLVSSAFWFAGPDTTSCECQREAAY